MIVTTHICPRAPVIPHDPVPFMGSPVDMATMNRHEVRPEMDAILSIDTTRGNWVVNRRGFAVSPTVKAGLYPEGERRPAPPHVVRHRDSRRWCCPSRPRTSRHMGTGWIT